MKFKFGKKTIIIENPSFLLVLIALGIATGILFAQTLTIEQRVAGMNISIPTITPTAVPTVTPDIPTPTITKKVDVAPTVVPTTDPDPPVLCNVNSNCGGGTKLLKQSECNNSICCQVNGKWSLYLDKNQCTRDQQASRGIYTPPTYPTYAPMPTTAYPTYPPYATPTISDSQAQATIDSYNQKVEQCRSNVANQYAGLIQSCNQYGGSSAYDACKTAYEGQRQNAYNACGSTY